MYLIKGDENYFIEQKTREIVQNFALQNNHEIRVINYSIDIDIEKFVSEIFDVDIFSPKKIIVLQNIDFLNAKSKIKPTLLDEIIHILETKNDDIEIVFTQYIAKYDKTFTPSKVFNFLLNNAVVIDCKKLSDWALTQFVAKMIEQKGGKTDVWTVTTLLLSLPNDLQIINNEIDRLMLLNKNITIQMIQNNTLNIGSNIDFAFSNAFIDYSSISEIIAKLQEQLNYGISASQIISQMTNILYDAQWLYFLKNKYSSDAEINKILNMNEYKLKLTRSFLEKIGYSKIKKLTTKLAKLDKDIKLGYVDEIIGIETFMLNLFQ